ncbi:hypothetical protein [Jannaschia marina]|uniref:hypothetical protein n=1 Tax=Jannaschia marina TaxID=2741674 RepID=UPI0015CA4357|nr:hypothetical protein [Jannaschia marina]
MVNRRFVALALALGVAGLGAAFAAWRMGRDAPVTLDPPATLELRLLGSVPDLLELPPSVLDLGTVGIEGLKDVGALFFQALASSNDGPDGYIVRFSDDGCDPVALSAGRMTSVSYEALWIVSVNAVLPMEPLAFDAARALAEDIDAAMTRAGWERVFHRPEFTPGSIAEKMVNAHTLSRFRVCGRPGTTAQITVESFNDGPSGYSIPPAAAGSSPPDEVPDLYLLRIDVRAADVFSDRAPDLKSEVEALTRARRRALTGDPNTPILLQTWLDDPDWRPED